MQKPREDVRPTTASELTSGSEESTKIGVIAPLPDLPGLESAEAPDGRRSLNFSGTPSPTG